MAHLLPTFRRGYQLWQDHFRWLEFGLTLVATAIMALWLYRWDGGVVLNELLADKRSNVYGALAALLGSLLGFVIAAVAIVIGETSRLNFIREAGQLGNLLAVFRMAIVALGVGTVAALIAMIADSESSPLRWTVVLVFFATLLSVFRIGRAIWVLDKIVKHVGKQHSG
jgi:hypothetical protein